MSSVRSGAGATPRLGAGDLVAAVPELADIAEIEAHTFSTMPSSDMTFDDVLALYRVVLDRASEVTGVVVTHGTDTLEEAAFALDLLWDGCPLVVTGAMRNASLPGSDGGANLLAAVVTAASPAAAGAGVLVVANDEIHAAVHVRKGHTQSVAAFHSPGHGPVGYVAEHSAHLVFLPRRRRRIDPIPSQAGRPVALLTIGMGEDARLLGAVLNAGFGGVVIEALGGGHLPAGIAASTELKALVDAMPVVLASRVGAGAVLERTYTFAGSETDLLARGLLSAGALDGRKARVLLGLLLAGSRSRQEVEAEFAARTRL